MSHGTAEGTVVPVRRTLAFGCRFNMERGSGRVGR
jgi:hypothetical protein